MFEDVCLTGSVAGIIFQNKENGYAVFTIEQDEQEITCTGIVPDLHEGEKLNLSGRWNVHPTYGRQFLIEGYEKVMPDTVEGIEKYLSSGVIRGIGPKTAKKIVEKFGEASFYVIEEKPDRLSEIKGITYDKAKEINKIFIQQHEMRRAMMFLQNFGVSPNFAMKIYKKYKDRTFDVVKNNPYRLADDILGIGFKMADKIAASSGIRPDSAHRIKCGIRYILNDAAASGHVYLPKKELADKTTELLNISCDAIENSIIELQMEHQIWQEKIEDEDVIYLNFYYYAEISTAKKLLELCDGYSEINIFDTKDIIEQAEIKNGITLAKEQKEAIEQSVKNNVLVITGGPGTGKTTIIKIMISIFNDENKKVVLAAPTGRAAKRIAETTGKEAFTIHRLLGISYVNEDTRVQSFDKDEDNPIEADIIIIDESSMIDILLMNSLLKAVRPGTKFIMVGDVDQLPSVGAGNVLKDIIKSERIPVVRLNEIFRQARESDIIVNAHRINMGEEPVLNNKDKDFFFVKRGYIEDVVLSIVELVTKRLPKFSGCDPFLDIQVLTPMRKSPIGVYELNNTLQEALNPHGKGKSEKKVRNITFREGDKVMQIKNNYNMVWRIYDKKGRVIEEDLGVFNGDSGNIVSIDEYEEKITVVFDDEKYVQYDFTQLDELELAYAITIHKSQGSEYPVVIIPIHSGPPMLMSRNLLYTAVTRAKKMVVLVGIPATMKKMIENDREIKRYSTLDLRIKGMYDFMNEK